MYTKKHGMALVSVIITMVVFMILGTAILAVTYSENKQVHIQKEMIQDYYVARSGADSVASYIIQNPLELDNIIQKTKSGPIIGDIDGIDFEVYVTGTEHEFVIESIAFDSEDFESSRVYLKVADFNLLDFAVFANESFNTGQNAAIKGNLGTNAASITFGNELIDGNVMLGPGATPADIASAEAKIESDHTVTQASTNVILPLADPNDFSEPLPNGTTNIDTTAFTLVDGKLIRSLDRIDLSGSNIFYVHGGGSVHLFINDMIKLSGNASIETDSTTKLFLYYNNEDTITYSGTPSSNIVLYAPKATVEYNGGGSGTTYGSIITNIFIGPNSSAASITQTTLGAENLLISGTGYHRSVWSK